MRQFVSSSMPDSKGRIALTKKEFRYLSRVLRLQSGTPIDVRLSDGRFVSMLFCADKAEPFLAMSGAAADTRALKAAAQNSAATANSAVIPGGTEAFVKNGAPAVRAGGTPTCQKESAGDKKSAADTARAELWLFQFLPKPQKIDLIVRQATECGVSRIVPVKGEYSPPSQGRTERWRRIIREARQQSGSPTATDIPEPMSAHEAAALWRDQSAAVSSAAFMLCEKADANGPSCSLFSRIADAVQKAGGHLQRIALAVGCEGGISPDERILFEQSGFMPIHFKTNILRTETAALYGLAALQSAVTEYEKWKLNE